jgi:hypothetical protein
MKGRPLLSSVNLWERHRERCLDVLREALSSLADGSANERETDINRRLYRAIVATEHAQARRSETQQLSVVVPEGRNPPVGSDEERSTRENKIPDFYWSYIDDLAAVPEDAARQFVVECKRLTKASRNWDYLEQYIGAGVMRFITVEHGYGQGCGDGAMVGYLQQMTVEEALAGVNAAAEGQKVPTLVVQADSGGRPVELDHELVRPFPISPFRLFHVWVTSAP